MSDQDRYMEIVEAAFDDYIVEFELDTEGSIDDLFFEIRYTLSYLLLL